MALSISTNLGALKVAATISSRFQEMSTSMERLSTGKRINSAADDAAGVAIASRLTSEIRGTNQAIRNAMDAQSLVDTAEGAYNEIESTLQRIREIAIQAANDTNSDADRAHLYEEINFLVDEIKHITTATTWAGIHLIKENCTLKIQAGGGTQVGETITLSTGLINAASISEIQSRLLRSSSFSGNKGPGDGSVWGTGTGGQYLNNFAFAALTHIPQVRR